MRKRDRLRREKKIKCKIIAYMVIAVMSIIAFTIAHDFANALANGIILQAVDDY